MISNHSNSGYVVQFPNYKSFISEKHTVFVGNIAFDATEDELKNVFEENGLAPSGVRILTRNDGKSKG